MTYTPDDIKRLMRERLPSGVQELIGLVSAEAERMGMPIYLVGGFVRDLLLDRPIVDVDFVVEGDPDQLVEALDSNQGSHSFYYSTRFFGTAKWVLNAELIRRFQLCPIEDNAVKDQTVWVDFARTRRETYAHPGALPTVDPTFVALEDDLKRRDFTINTLAIQLPIGKLIDRLNGIDDLLRTRSIRVLHDRSFIDDPTRLFRAARFEQRFDFRIEPHTESLIAPALSIIGNLSGERIRNELDLIFQEAEPEKAMMRLKDLDVLRQIDPDLRFDAETAEAFQVFRQHATEQEYPRPIRHYVYWPIWACDIDPPVWERLQLRLPFSNDKRVIVEQTLRAVSFVQSHPGQLKPSEFAKHIEPFNRIHAQVAAWIVLLNTPDSQIRAYIDKRMDKIHPELTGSDLIAMGLQPGPAFGTILRQLRDARLDGEISTGEAERAWVKKWIDQGLDQQL